jgi:indole-3-acetate monooxygenase
MTTETIDTASTGEEHQFGPPPSTLEAVRALAPAIAARAEEIERARRLPVDLVAQLRAAGCFRMLVPRSHGGDAASLPEHAELIRELSRADGSVGWTVTIGSAAPVFFGQLPAATFDAIYANGPDVVSAGAFNPTGVATPVDGGYRVSGRWAFASGCQHADWFVAHCLIDGRSGDGPLPPLRVMVLPASDVDIIDTWSVSGLCGTGSHDFTLDGAFVAEHYTFSIFEEGGLPGPLGRIPELSLSSLSFANVALGIAQGALAEITTLASAKVPMLASSTLAGNPLFRYQLGEADALLRAATALLDAEVAEVWETAVAGEEPTPERRARTRSAAIWVTTAAARVVDVAYTLGGGSSVYSNNPLQRRWRDVHAVTQHFAVKPDTLTTVGAVLAGEDVDTTLL